MRKTFFNIILVAAFLFLTTAIILIFLADLQFNEAKKMEGRFRWQKAEEKYLTAIKLDPANAQVLSGYGDFLRNKSAYQKNPIMWLLKAEKFYECALELNSRDAKTYLNLGQAQLALFLKDKQKYADKLNSALGNFKKALREDPNGFNISYETGYVGLAIWNYLDNEEKELILNRLRYIIGLRPGYFEYIYPRLWKITKDVKLLQCIRAEEPRQEKEEKLKKIAKIKQDAQRLAHSSNIILSTQWQGVAKDGKTIYNQGNMYWSGAIFAPVHLPAGEAVVKIQALGSKARGIYPYMIVELDGEEIGEIFVDSPEWKEYGFKANTNGSIKVLSVTFLNDYCTEKEDRNLIIGEARVDER